MREEPNLQSSTTQGPLFDVSSYVLFFKPTEPLMLFSPLSQVSHHPPAAAHHVISDRGWTLRQEITVASKFRGKYLSIMPLGKRQISSKHIKHALRSDDDAGRGCDHNLFPEHGWSG